MNTEWILVIAVVCAVASARPTSQENDSRQHISVVSDEERSIGKIKAKKGQFPYVVAIQKWKPIIGSFKHICGGTIISRRSVLTAAHCISPKLKVIAGEYDLSSEEGTEQHRGINRSIIHPKYNSSGTKCPSFDIAILVLDYPFVFNEYVMNIDIARQGHILEKTATFSGWGFTEPAYNSISSVLRTEDLLVLDETQCLTEIDHLNTRKIYLPNINTLCTKTRSESGPCKGDSGGPLVQGGVLVGILSWGILPCGADDTPFGFTRVSAFEDWILAEEQARQRIFSRST